jgi:serine palmitoyltransferase
MDLERDVAEFLGTEDSIPYSQTFSKIPSTFAKRGVIIVADRGNNFHIQKGLQISRLTVHRFEHNDLTNLEDDLLCVS